MASGGKPRRMSWGGSRVGWDGGHKPGIGGPSTGRRRAWSRRRPWGRRPGRRGPCNSGGHAPPGPAGWSRGGGCRRRDRGGTARRRRASGGSRTRSGRDGGGPCRRHGWSWSRRRAGRRRFVPGHPPSGPAARSPGPVGRGPCLPCRGAGRSPHRSGPDPRDGTVRTPRRPSRNPRRRPDRRNSDIRWCRTDLPPRRDPCAGWPAVGRRPGIPRVPPGRRPRA